MLVVDCHMHIGDLSASLGDGASHAMTMTVEEERAQRVARLADSGADWAIIQPAHSYLRPDGIKDTMRVNDGMAAYRAADSKHFPVALGTVEPLYGERSLEEIDRCKHELGLDGLSWHPRLQGVFLDNPWMRPYVKRMSELGLVPVLHCNAESKMEASWRMQKLAFEFPEVTFMAFDSFWSYERSMETLHLAAHTPNVLWDTGGPLGFHMIERFVQEHGSERFTYSGEAAYASAPVRGGGGKPRLLQQILNADISDEDKANILGGNAARLFGKG